VPAPCRPDHVFREPLPDGLALYPFGYRYPVEKGWLADEALLAHVDRLGVPAVYLDVGTVQRIGKREIGAIILLAKRAHDRGGRMVLCNVGQEVREVIQIFRLDKLSWFDLRDGGMPGRGPPDPAWLSWGGGVVAAMARCFAEGRDLGLMPVLADALEEAGCTDADLLNHLRSPTPHVRGCWALDLILGKR